MNRLAVHALLGVLLCSVSCAAAAPLSVAVCFFGLTRSLHLTIDSIRHSILDPLWLNDVEVTIYLHTYNATSISNPRSNENNAAMDWQAFKLLRPFEWQIDDADAVSHELIDPHLSAWLKHGDGWAGETAEHTSLRNLLRQLYSISQVTKMWTQQAARFDLVLYLRSDVWFFNRLNVAEFVEATKHPKRLYTPKFHQWAGLNDRLAFGTPDVMSYYGSRLNAAMQFAQQQALHAERFLLHTATQAGLDISGRTNLLFERVRATGELWGIPTGQTVVGNENVFLKRPGLKVQRNQHGIVQFVPL